jgi:hypothetical protein
MFRLHVGVKAPGTPAYVLSLFVCFFFGGENFFLLGVGRGQDKVMRKGSSERVLDTWNGEE